MRGTTSRPLLIALALLAALALPASADIPDEHNLLIKRPVWGERIAGDPALLTDGDFFAEGAPPGPPVAAALLGRRAQLVVDAGRSRTIRALLMQADGDDTYVVEGSDDGWAWTSLWTAPRSPAGKGLRQRQTQLAQPVQARYLRVRAGRGDAPFGISELRAFEQPPQRREVRRVFPRDPTWRPALSNARIGVFKGAVALAALGLLLWGIVAARAGRPELDRRIRRWGLIAIGGLSVVLWFNVGRLHPSGFVHYWEFYHHYVNARYLPELGYQKLYECVLIADAEDGVPGVTNRRLRDLTTNRLVPAGPVLADPSRCKASFRPERWESFKDDLSFFRERLPAIRWEESLRDHGFNATPVWLMFAGTLARLIPPSPGSVLVLAQIDLLLLALTFGAVGRTFGWRPALLGLIWFGTSYLTVFGWTGGSFVRYDWLVAGVAGLCCVRAGRPLTGGFLMTLGTLFRVYPGFMVAGLVLKVLLDMVRRKKPTMERTHLRFAAGCVLALATVFPASLAVAGWDGWKGFSANSATYLNTYTTNAVGLKSLLSWDRDTRLEVMRDPGLEDPDAAWKAARAETVKGRSWIRWVLLAGYLFLLGRAVRRADDWVALVLGAGLIPLATAPASYYYAIFLVFGALWTRRGNAVGVGLLALAVATQIVYATWGHPIEGDECFAWINLLVVASVWTLPVVDWRRADPPPTGF